MDAGPSRSRRSVTALMSVDANRCLLSGLFFSSLSMAIGYPSD